MFHLQHFALKYRDIFVVVYMANHKFKHLWRMESMNITNKTKRNKPVPVTVLSRRQKKIVIHSIILTRRNDAV